MTLNAPVSNGLEGKFKLGTTFTVAIQKGKRCKAKFSTLIFIVPFFLNFLFHSSTVYFGNQLTAI